MQRDGDARLRLVGVTKRYGAARALDRVTLTVQPGDVYGFIGHNGAGKTTAMRVALGLVRQDEGRVLVDGFDAAQYPREARARLAGLIETPGFHGAWSGERNLAELLRVAGWSRGDARREAGVWIERLGLSGARTRAVRGYSQGMRQRLGIAQALMGNPRCVLLDEPTNGLDPEGIAEMRALLAELNRERGTTLVISSHQLHELSGLCNRIGVLRGGRLVAEEETKALLEGGAHVARAERPERAREALRALGLEPRDVTGGALEVELGGRSPSEVTEKLVASGAGLASFGLAPHSLERIYFRAQSATSAPSNVAAPAKAGAEPAERLASRAPFARALAAELRRVLAPRATLVLGLAPAAAGLIAILRRAGHAARDAGAVEGQEVFSATGFNGFEAVGVALQAGLAFLAFLALGFASQSLAAELGQGTLRNLLLRPLGRPALALGKLAAQILLVFGAFAALVATALAAAWALVGFGDVVEQLPNGQTFLLVEASALWPELVHALCAPVVPLAAFAALGFLAGAVTRTGAAALALALAAGALLDVGRALTRSAGLAGALPSDHLSSPLSDTSFTRFYVEVSQGISNARFEHGALATWVPLAWAAAAGLAATAVLARRDVP